MSGSLIDTLDWGTRLEGNVITYAFYRDGTVIHTDVDEDNEAEQRTLIGWNDYEKQQARLALSLFERYTQLTFVEVDEPAAATLRFSLYDFGESSSTLGWAVPPGETYQGQTPGFAAFNVTHPLWSREPGGSLEQGGYSFITLTHEFGHLFGLAHPHDHGGDSPLMPGVVQDHYYPSGSLGFYELNQGVYTMMSYNDGWRGPVPPSDDEAPFGWGTGPSALDIALLQRKYGVNPEPDGEAGTVYELLDEPVPGWGYTTIWNVHGGHTIRYDGTEDVVINLMPASLELEWGGGGGMSFVRGVSGGYTIAHGVEVVSAISGAGDDVLLGNALDNVFDPGAGNNTIHGNGGMDLVRYTGDILDYSVSRGDSAWYVAAEDESRVDILHGVRMLDFGTQQAFVEALVQESLVVGGLYVALLGRLPEAGGYQYWTKAVLAGTPLDAVASQFAVADEFAAGRGTLTDAAFVDLLYHELLLREADAEGSAYWQSLLADGILDRGEVALSFLTAEEQEGAFAPPLVAEVVSFGDLWA